MGLDVTAYGRIQLIRVDPDPNAEWWDWPHQFRAWVNPDFPGRAGDVEHLGVYNSERHMDFQAGGYGGYNQWRDQLRSLGGLSPDWKVVEATPGGPFWEQVWFSDCEGIIGCAVSAKLAADYAAYDAKAAVISNYFYDKYKLWRAAFEMAADGGCVRFH